jgi:hypothetical protein
MRHPTDMPELQENKSALGMNGVGDFPPALDLIIRINAGRGRISASGSRDRRRLRDELARSARIRVSGAMTIRCCKR